MWAWSEGGCRPLRLLEGRAGKGFPFSCVQVSFNILTDCSERLFGGLGGICLVAEEYDGPELVNLGAGFEIKDLVELAAKLMDFGGEIGWDKTKSAGQPRRPLNVSNAERLFGFRTKTKFEDRLKKTIEWCLANRKKVT